MQSISFKKQLPKNLIINIISFVINVFIGLWLVPYLVNEIGTIAYGLIPLAMIFTEYISVITISINGAINRFITFDIQNENWVNANKTFNTAFFALFSLVFIQVLFFSYLTFEIDKVINVPHDLVIDAYYLFGFTFLGFLVSLFSSVFSSSLHANNRLDLSQSVDISRIVVRVLVIVFFFSWTSPSLRIVGIANFTGAIVSLLLSIFYWRKLTPQLLINFKFYDKTILKNILGMGGWLIISSVGSLLFLKIDLLIINILLGSKAGGEFAVVQQWNILIRTVLSVFSGVVGPMILISVAKNNFGDVINFGIISVKFFTLAIGLITGIICGFATQLLVIWIGNDFADLATLLIIMLCHLAINLGVLPLFQINVAFNKLKIPAIVTLGMGALNFVFVLAFVKFFNLGLIGVALAGAIVLTLKNALFTPWYAAKILKIKLTTFYKPLLSGVLFFVATFLVTSVIGNYVYINSWFRLITLSSLIFIVASSSVWILILKNDEKKMLIGLLPKNLVLNNFKK